MNVKRIRKYFIPIVFSFVCVLSGCSSNVTSDNQNNTVKKEKNSTLEGTWKVKDFQDTIKQLSQVGANRVDVEKRIKNFYNDFDMTLTITNDNAVLHYTFDVTKLYEYYFNNFEKGVYDGLDQHLEQYINKKRTSFNVNYNVLEHTKAIREGDKIDYTLKNGEIDEDKVQIYGLRKQGYSLEKLSNKFGINNSNLRYMIKLIDRYGIEFGKKGKNRYYSPDLKQEMINKVIHEGWTKDRVSLEYGLPSRTILLNWLAQYKKNGYTIVEKTRGRVPKMGRKPKKRPEERTELEEAKAN